MAKKHKIKTKGLKKTLLKNKWQVIIVVLLAAIILYMIVGENSVQKPADSGANPSPQPDDSSPGFNGTRNLYLTGNDPSLNHEIGAEGAGKTWISTASDGEGYMITGPFVNIPPGAYKISFDIMAEGLLNDTMVCTIEFSSDRGKTITRTDLYGKDFKEGQFKTFPINIITGKIIWDAEFKVFRPDNGINITVRKIILTPGATTWNGNSQALTHDIGVATSEGFWTSGSGGEGYLIRGPHITLAPGVYEVSYTFLIEEFPTDEQKYIADIDVSYDGGQNYLPGKLVGLDWTSGNPNRIPMLKSFINRIYVENTMNDVEFRLYYPNSSVKVTLKDINVFIK
ncbi:MAG: hypothetical protein PHG85_05435 [Candidatus Altiarchaeota archaeon]|nr:hypothetical protein [Candidatus Altiarchaeota archaeon]